MKRATIRYASNVACSSFRSESDMFDAANTSFAETQTDAERELNDSLIVFALKVLYQGVSKTQKARMRKQVEAALAYEKQQVELAFKQQVAFAEKLIQNRIT